MQLVILLVVGGVIGWLASIIMKTNAQMGIIANVVVGVVGTILGFWIASQLGFDIEPATFAGMADRGVVDLDRRCHLADRDLEVAEHLQVTRGAAAHP